MTVIFAAPVATVTQKERQVLQDILAIASDHDRIVQASYGKVYDRLHVRDEPRKREAIVDLFAMEEAVNAHLTVSWSSPQPSPRPRCLASRS